MSIKTIIPPFKDIADSVCSKIPPLWELNNFVAVNPFLGYSDRPILEAVWKVRQGLDADLLPGIPYFQRLWNNGTLKGSEIDAAAAKHGLSADQLIAYLENSPGQTEANLYKIETNAERIDRQTGSGFVNLIEHTVAGWLAELQFGTGIDPCKPGELFAHCLESARNDRTFELEGARGWNGWFAHRSFSTMEFFNETCANSGRNSDETEIYFYRLLGQLYGWASYLRRLCWNRNHESTDLVCELLCVLFVCDTALGNLISIASDEETSKSDCRPSDLVRLALQDAVEDSYAATVIRSFRSPKSSTSLDRAQIQAVFCIDVRSEVLRRHLESQSPDIQTLGFAGFFGVSLGVSQDHIVSPRTPALLNPSHIIEDHSFADGDLFLGSFAKAQKSPAIFSAVELLGTASAVQMMAELLTIRPSLSGANSQLTRLKPLVDRLKITLPDQAAIAAAILKNTGLSKHMGKLVVLCGHGAVSENNAQHAGIECGACGGHSGALNALVAALILNNADVREKLREDYAVAVPSDTSFVPALHVTTTDEVIFLDTSQVPEHTLPLLDSLRQHFAQAEVLTRRERAAALGLTDSDDATLFKSLTRRSKAWSEIRPEWGLAGNAAFVAARRERTRQINLHGRAFLHDYDESLDVDGSVLGLILNAPMIVASWINLQYFASTVDNARFGSGPKAQQNRVGDIGVVIGNGGDIRSGLTIESVHKPNGEWFHQPLRLQVFIEASPEKIDRALDLTTTPKDLADHGWIRIYALEPDSRKTMRREKSGVWQAVS